MINPTNPNQVGPELPGRHAREPGGPSAYAACTVAPNFPSLFGGGMVPTVNRDP